MTCFKNQRSANSAYIVLDTSSDSDSPESFLQAKYSANRKSFSVLEEKVKQKYPDTKRSSLDGYEPISVSEEEVILPSAVGNAAVPKPDLILSDTNDSIPSLPSISLDNSGGLGAYDCVSTANSRIPKSSSGYLSSSSSELNFRPLHQRLGSNINIKNPSCTVYKERTQKHSLSDSEDDLHVPVKNGKKNLVKLSSQENLVESKDVKKKQKLEERKQKQLEKEKLKRQKEAEKEMQKISNPAECLKTVTACIDTNILEIKGADELLNAFQSENVNYSLKQQALQNTITWKREHIEPVALNDSQFEQKKKLVLQDQVAVILSSEAFVSLVDVETKQGYQENPMPDSLWGYIKEVKSLFPEMKPTLLILGMEQYFKKHKTKENKNFRTNMAGDVSPPKRKRATKASNIPLVTRIEVEEALAKVQLAEKVNFRVVESMTEIGEIIFMFTKSISEKYLRKNQGQGEDFESYLVDSFLTYKVDKEGKGLLKIWEQQLMTFHQVSTDMAQAITSKYPSPLSLLKAYEDCVNTSSAERLLEKIEVRRGFGPLNTTRRIGPELSSKIYLHLTSQIGETALYH